MTSTIASSTVSTRTILGADYPVSVQVTRFSRPDRRSQWSVAFGVCNGIADRSRTFSTRTAAMAAFNSHLKAF
jgi:hypothetical protein